MYGTTHSQERARGRGTSKGASPSTGEFFWANFKFFTWINFLWIIESITMEQCFPHVIYTFLP